METFAQALALARVELTTAKNSSTQNSPNDARATPSQDALPDVPKSANLSGPKYTDMAYAVRTYTSPIESAAPSTARRMVRRGSLVSSARGAAASKPANARIVYTDPANTALMPSPPPGAFPVPNTDRVLSGPALPISTTANPTKTSTSKMPRTVPNRAEARTPKYPAAAMTADPSSDQGHQRPAGQAGHCSFRVPAVVKPSWSSSSAGIRASTNT